VIGRHARTGAGKTGFTKPRPQHVRRRGPAQRQALVEVQMNDPGCL